MPRMLRQLCERAGSEPETTDDGRVEELISAFSRLLASDLSVGSARMVLVLHKQVSEEKQ